ncbi:MAG: hypothetical protein ACJ8AW_44005 [Rhodopila sp.]
MIATRASSSFGWIAAARPRRVSRSCLVCTAVEILIFRNHTTIAVCELGADLVVCADADEPEQRAVVDHPIGQFFPALRL